MATLLEQTRVTHEEVERLERLIVEQLAGEAHTYRQRLAQSQTVAYLVDQITARAAKLRDVYEDADGARKEEIAALGGGDNVFGAFYDRLRDVRDAHRHFPNALASTREELDAALVEPPAVEFTGEEGLGRYVDLHQHFSAFVNAPFGRKVEYLAFLDALCDGHTFVSSIARPKKLGTAYTVFINALSDYLLDWHGRAQPLSFTGPALEQAQRVFDQAWAEGAVAGWEDRGCASGATHADNMGLDLDAFSSAEALMTAVGAAPIKEALQRMGLKTGGTEVERAERLFSAKGKTLQELDKKLFVRGGAPPVDADGARVAEARARDIAAAEARLLTLLDMHSDVIRATRGNVEKKSTLSYAELEAERMEEEEDLPEAGDEPEAELIYNPLKLPLGWDGKPIPYWLYKLHGLNQEFKCEICGNFSYWGRRAYERHFREARHQYGMRCLKVPNTKAFLEVTTIADALALHKSMQDKGAQQFRADADEEFEDADGNVYRKTVYLDLQRQGLL